MDGRINGWNDGWKNRWREGWNGLDLSKNGWSGLMRVHGMNTEWMEY